ncbi:MAG: hypothetical protein IPJ43_20670 [Saprospiraceae bacterium]|nr:hypothetical protein [Saprospiraceae bacterium]
MLARQSDKVVVLGQNSRGMMDYGNIVHYKTTCPKSETTTYERTTLARYRFSVDIEAKPDIYLSGKNWVDKAIKVVKK